MRVRVSDVCKEFVTKHGRVQALAGVSFEVEEQEFFGIIGPNGCGKTTLLHIIAGLAPPTSGRVEFLGEQRAESRVAMVFQQHALLPWRVVERNVGLAPELRGKPEPLYRRITGFFMRLTRLKDVDALYPHQLSGGMQHKAAIARALAAYPEVLLMDEPFGNLDAMARMLLREEIQALWERERKTVLFVTHSLEEAVLLCDRIAVLSARPGSVKAVLRVGLPRPRTHESLTHPAYAETMNRLWELLREDVERAMREPPPRQARHR
ncbi:MAG: ATP-binding cassette domain-containing protein [Deltaproteobacteria bacterium]|nr:ATP-binding cassette domain-containing protein [Deltaproteobacteria bacterium]MBI3079164.1 ATP-binding cassette domain-containing protein [Deltaproteobacteria bacterium]